MKSFTINPTKIGYISGHREHKACRSGHVVKKILCAEAMQEYFTGERNTIGRKIEAKIDHESRCC